MSYLPDPQSHPELFQGVLARRAVAWLIDLVVLGMLVLALLLGGLVFGVMTLGLGFLALPIAVPVAVLAYYALTLGSPMRATLGMRAMDIVLTPARGRPLDGWAILIHPLVFWVTVWISWPITVAIALFTPRRQLVHDLIAGTLMVRRSPMERRFRYADA
jgi:uncharacterized RDD family membrane protein YckC